MGVCVIDSKEPLGVEAARDAGTGGAAPDAGIVLRDALRF